MNGSSLVNIDIMGNEPVTRSTGIFSDPNNIAVFDSYYFDQDVDIDAIFSELMETFSANFSSNLSRNVTKQKMEAFQLTLWYLNLYLTPVIILIGLVGNLLSFLVFTFTHVQKLSASIYLSSLAVADIVFLLALTMAWIDRQLGITVFVTEGWCQFVVYFTHVAGFIAVWNVLGFTAERYIIAYHPLKKDVLCTRKKSIIVVVCLSFLALLFYSYVLWTYDVIRFGSHVACSPSPQYHDINNILMSIDTFIACVIPSIVIVILNVKIFIKIHQFQQKHFNSQSDLIHQGVYFRNRSNIQTSVSTSGSVHIRFSTNRMIEMHEPVEEQDSPNVSNYRAAVRGNSQFRTARMLLVLSSVFVLLNLPYHIFRVHSFLGHLLGLGPKVSKNKMAWLELFHMLYFLNFAINFFIYSACGQQFRVGLKRLARRWKRRFNRCRKEAHKMGRNGNLTFETTL